MADSFNKKEREKKRRKRKQDKVDKREQKKLDGTKPVEFMYLDENGNLTPTPPDPVKRRKIKAEDIEISTPKQGKSGQPNFMRAGVVKFFNSEKGYGFIADQGAQEDFFFHIDNMVDEVSENDSVTFEVGSGPKGPVAINVKLATTD